MFKSRVSAIKCIQLHCIKVLRSTERGTHVSSYREHGHIEGEVERDVQKRQQRRPGAIGPTGGGQTLQAPATQHAEARDCVIGESMENAEA